MKKKYEGLLAVDPGSKMAGWCIFNEGRYIASGLARPFSNTNQLDCLKNIVDIIDDRWETFISGTKGPQILVVEKPQIYQQKHLKGDPNDLIPLAILAGVIWERMDPQGIMLPLPKEWKGQVPKNVMTNRTIASLSSREQDMLTDDVERIPSYLRHNVYDAVGIALWGVNRMGGRKID